MVDSTGAIYQGREKGMNPVKDMIAGITNISCITDMDSPHCVRGDLADAVKDRDVFIGVSTAGILTPDMVRTMQKDPIIFAMANPTPEIMPEEAKKAGARIIGTGRSDYPNQVNNVLAFPGIFR